jgi:predicted permease
MVFPNIGFTISIIDIGEQLESQGLLWVGSIMSILIFIMWLFVIACECCGDEENHDGWER